MSTFEPSRHVFSPRWGAVVGLLLMTSACGWRTGRAPIGPLSVGDVGGATVEPGLRAELRGETARALRQRGVPDGGPDIVMSIVEADHASEAVDPSLGTSAAWAADLVVEFAIPSRGGCSVQISARRTWLQGAGASDGVVARQEAVNALAGELAQRGVNALAANPDCRGER